MFTLEVDDDLQLVVETVRQLSPPSSVIHNEPVVEPMTRRSPVASTSRAWRKTRS